MRFLALSGLQAALLALVTAAAIIALYFLKLRHRRMVVASSLLWSRVLDERESQSLWEKLRRILSIIAAVLIGLLIALALGRPEIHGLTGGGERTLLVLDASPTMLARTSDGKTRWQHAVAAALSLVNSAAPSSEFRVADTTGRVDAQPTSDRREIRETLERMKPMAGTPRFPDSDGETTTVRFITDGVVPIAMPKGTLKESVYEEADNAGITAFEIRTTPSSTLGYEAYLELHNYAKSPREIRLTIAGAGGQRIERTLNLNGGGEFGDSFDLSKFQGGGVRATIQTAGDALALDDVAYAYLPVEAKTKTLLVTNGNPYLETVLRLDSLLDVTTIKPAQYQPDPGFDAYVFDAFAPLNPPIRPSLFIGETPSTGWLPKSNGSVADPRFATWLEDHPVMRYVSLHDVVLQKATRIDATNLTVLAQSENHSPLILASDAPGTPRWILLSFSLSNSDFPIHSGFPIFIDNALAWLSREPLALRRQPGLVSVPMKDAEIKALNGTMVPSHARDDQTIFEADEPGLYVATRETARQYVAVNLGNSQYSNINGSGTQKESAAASSSGWLQQELWFYMIAAAAILLCIEWFTYHKGVTL
jgi:hypothetical protein